MAHNYQKIMAPFGRQTPKDKLVDPNIYARKWVQMFVENNIIMLGQEKIDGTSVGIVWDGERVSFIGHTDKAQFSPRYLEYLKTTFGTPEFEEALEMLFGEKPVTLYGEGISKDYNAHYGFPEGNFIMYDIQNGWGTFYNREAVKEIANTLGLIYPWEKHMTIKEAIEMVSRRPKSYLDSSRYMEGLVLRPPIELYTNTGERIICKVKVRDFLGISYNQQEMH